VERVSHWQYSSMVPPPASRQCDLFIATVPVQCMPRKSDLPPDSDWYPHCRILVRLLIQESERVDLADFRELRQTTQQLVVAMRNPRNELMSRLAAASQTIVVGTQRHNEWEARLEIVFRAMEFLENC